MKMLISQRAEADLENIYAWLAVHGGEDVAEQFKINTEKALRLLQQHPEVGPQPSWFTQHHHLRFWIISQTNHVIYYEVGQNEIAIERVLDGRRDARRIIQGKIENPLDETS